MKHFESNQHGSAPTYLTARTTEKRKVWVVSIFLSVLTVRLTVSVKENLLVKFLY